MGCDAGEKMLLINIYRTRHIQTNFGCVMVDVTYIFYQSLLQLLNTTKDFFHPRFILSQFSLPESSNFMC